MTTSARLISFPLEIAERVVMAMVGGDWYGELTFRMRRRLIKINELIGSSPTAACLLACLPHGIPIIGLPWHPRGGVVVGCCSSEGVMGVEI